jgi:hypothetical protein
MSNPAIARISARLCERTKNGRTASHEPFRTSLDRKQIGVDEDLPFASANDASTRHKDIADCGCVECDLKLAGCDLTCTPDWYLSEVESFALMADG